MQNNAATERKSCAPQQKQQGVRQVNRQAPGPRPQGDRHVNNQAPQIRPPRRQVEAALNKQIEEVSLLLRQEQQKNTVLQKKYVTEVADLQKRVKVERCEGCELAIVQLKAEVKNLSPYYISPKDRFFYSLKTKEELMGVVFAQIKTLHALQAGGVIGDDPHMEALSIGPYMDALENELKVQRAANQALEKEMAELKKKLELSTTSEEKPDYTAEMQALQAPVASPHSQLQAEGQGADTLQKEQEESSCKRKVELLEAEKLALEQQINYLVKSSNTQLQAEKNRAENLKKQGQDLRSQLKTANNNLKQFQQQEAKKLAREQKTEAAREERRRKQDSDQAKKVEQLQELVESFKSKLQAEKNRTKTLENEREEIRSSLQETANQNLKKANQSEEEKLVLEQTVKELQEEVANKAETESMYLAKIQETLDLVAFQKTLLLDERQMADNLQTQLEEVRHQLLDRNSKDLKLGEEVTTEKEFLAQRVSDLQREAQNREEFYGEQLETLNSLLQEKNSTCFGLACEIEDQEEVSETLHQDLLETNMEITEETPEMEVISGATPERSTETPQVVRISLWRRFKKQMTPRHRRQYKQQTQDQGKKNNNA